MKSHSNIALIQPLNEFLWNDFQLFWDISPSWQSAELSMNNAKPTVLGAFIEDKLVSL